MRGGLYAAAAVFAAWSVTATVLWMSAADGVFAALSGSWSAARADWMVLLFLTDMAVFSLACIAWMASDLRRTGVPPGRRGAWLAATLLLGCPVLMVYLARRRTT